MTDKAGRTFIEHTKYRYLTQSDQMRGLPQPSLELPYDRAAQTIKLPDPQHCPTNGISVQDAIQRRHSVRQYAEEPLTLVELSYLLWCTQGVKEVTNRPVTLRTVPSAGARHALETYVLANRVQGLQPGLYRFAAIEHKLVMHSAASDIAEQTAAGCLEQRFVETCAAAFIWTAVPYRMGWRYGERGYRYLHLDVGHVCQSLYLSAESIDAGVCAIAAFDDDQMNHLLDIDGETQFTIYVATVGKR